MEELNDSFHFWTPHSFVEMRNIACTRITLVNGRRRGEVARFLVENWNDAESNAWIDDQRIQNLDEADKALIKALKITYMTGKGKHHTVPLIFPPDTVPSIQKLVDPKIRIISGVLKSNNYVFPSTRQSELSAMKVICNLLPLKNPNIITATCFRHRISALFAALDVPQHDKELFYNHMRHFYFKFLKVILWVYIYTYTEFVFWSLCYMVVFVCLHGAVIMGMVTGSNPVPLKKG